MIEPIYKKGHRLVWAGFLGGALCRLIKYALEANAAPGSSSELPSLFAWLSLAAFIALMYGAYLVLKSKNRSWTWLLLILVLNLIGLLIIFWLKDKSQDITPNAAPTSAPPTFAK